MRLDNISAHCSHWTSLFLHPQSVGGIYNYVRDPLCRGHFGWRSLCVEAILGGDHCVEATFGGDHCVEATFGGDHCVEAMFGWRSLCRGHFWVEITV